MPAKFDKIFIFSDPRGRGQGLQSRPNCAAPDQRSPEHGCHRHVSQSGSSGSRVAGETQPQAWV